MPMIATRGLMSSVGFGQFIKKKLTGGIFAQIIVSNNYWLYTFASDTAVKGISTGQSPLTNMRFSSVGTPVRLWTSLRSSIGTCVVQRMFWASQGSFTTFNLVPSSSSINPGAANNSVTGIITTSTSSSATGTTDILSMTSDTIAQGSNLLGPCYGGSAAVGTPTHALFSLTGTAIKQTNKYAYADNSVVGGTNLTLTTYDRQAAIGNADHGIFCQGNNTVNTCKYVHAGDTAAASTVLSAANYLAGGWNNDVGGTIAGSTSSWTKWEFAADTVAALTVSAVTGVGTSPFVYGGANGIPGVSA